MRASVGLCAFALASCAASGNRPAPSVVPRPVAEPRATGPVVGPALGTGAGPVSGTPASPGAPVGPSLAAPARSEMGPADPVAADPVAAPHAGEPHSAAPVTAEPALVVATVAGTRVLLEDLLGAWLRRDGAGVRGLLDDLVLSRIVDLEAGRLGATLPAGLLARALDQRREALAAEAAKAGVSNLETFIRTRIGMDPAQFFAGLERELRIDLLAPRAVRGWLLLSERAEVSVIAVSTPEARDRVQAKLAARQAFADVARELSEDPTRDEGGRMAPVVRGESTLAQLAFATPVGEVAGPIDERGRWLFLRVDARPRLEAGPWDRLGPVIEASLLARGIEDPEYWQWQQAMQALYEVDLEPFRALLGGRP
ncbi:MAG: peptidyl-prolyl cis-trans isomerase [Planctomycetota bacterium]